LGSHCEAAPGTTAGLLRRSLSDCHCLPGDERRAQPEPLTPFYSTRNRDHSANLTRGAKSDLQARRRREAACGLDRHGLSAGSG